MAESTTQQHGERIVSLESVPVKKIVARNRARKDVGDISGLADSISRVGLLHPIVLNSRHELIAGARRLAAVKKHGWKEVPCRVVDTLDDALLALQAERDENTCREPLAPSEMVKLGEQIEAIEKPEAENRKGARTDTPAGKLPAGGAGRVRDKVGKAVGVSGKTYEKAKAVADAAKENPEAFGDLPAKMDAESVDAAHKELKERQKEIPEVVDEGAGFVAEVETLCRDVDQIAARMKAFKQSRFAYSIHIDSAVAQVEAARKALWQGRPAYPCPYCEANETVGCKSCQNTGRVKKATRESGLEAVGGAK